jgi:hypothetical protein
MWNSGQLGSDSKCQRFRIWVPLPQCNRCGFLSEPVTKSTLKIIEDHWSNASNARGLQWGRSPGGGFYGSNGLIQNSGEMEFTNCSSGQDGVEPQGRNWTTQGPKVWSGFVFFGATDSKQVFKLNLDKIYFRHLAVLRFLDRVARSLFLVICQLALSFGAFPSSPLGFNSKSETPAPSVAHISWNIRLLRKFMPFSSANFDSVGKAA